MAVKVLTGTETNVKAVQTKLRTLAALPCCNCNDAPECPCTKHTFVNGQPAKHSISRNLEAIHVFRNEKIATEFCTLVPSTEESKLTAQDTSTLTVKTITDVTKSVGESSTKP